MTGSALAEAYVHLLVAKLAYLGVVVVAAGFALQDILSNLVAGMLPLPGQPFTKGDLIVTSPLEAAECAPRA